MLNNIRKPSRINRLHVNRIKARLANNTGINNRLTRILHTTVSRTLPNSDANNVNIANPPRHLLRKHSPQGRIYHHHNMYNRFILNQSLHPSHLSMITLSDVLSARRHISRHSYRVQLTTSHHMRNISHSTNLLNSHTSHNAQMTRYQRQTLSESHPTHPRANPLQQTKRNRPTNHTTKIQTKYSKPRHKIHTKNHTLRHQQPANQNNSPSHKLPKITHQMIAHPPNRHDSKFYTHQSTHYTDQYMILITYATKATQIHKYNTHQEMIPQNTQTAHQQPASNRQNA